MAVHYALFRGDDEAGRQHFDRFAILVPSGHSPDLFRGILSLRTGDRDSAKAALERSHRSILLQLGGDVARATFPHDGHGTLPATLLGWLLVDEGRPLDAARFFDEALEIAELPDDTELPSFRHWRRNLHLGKALVSLRSGAGPDALAEADRWIETASTEPHAFGLDAAVRAARSLAAGDRETARRELRIARRGRELARELAVTDQNFDAVLPRTIGLIDEIEAALGR